MPLLELPAELLTLISAETIPHTFESFALSCKTIFEVSQRLFERHKFLKRYQDFSFRNGVRSSSGWEIRMPIQLLYEIHRHPEIAGAITSADLRALMRDIPGDEDMFDESEADNHIKCNWAAWQAFDLEKQLTDFWIDPRMLNLDSGEEDRLETVRRDALDDKLLEDQFVGFTDDVLGTSLWHDVTTALLVARLPNLRSLAATNAPIVFKNYNRDVYKNLVSSMMSNANMSTGHHANGYKLPLLYEIHPSFCHHEENPSWVPISNFEKILSLKSLEVCIQTNCMAIDTPETDRQWSMKLSPGFHCPALRELVLWNSIFGPREIRDLTSRMPNLQIFRLGLTNWKYCKYTYPNPTTTWDLFSPEQIIRQLGRTVGKQLRGLGLTVDAKLDDLGDCGQGIKSLKPFQQLEELELCCSMFFDERVYADSKVGRKWLRLRLPRLVDILPRSIRRIRLKIPMDDATIEAGRHGLDQLLCDFQDAAIAALPHLQALEIVPSLSEAIGIELTAVTQFPDDDLNAEIQRMVKDLDKVQILEHPGFKFMTFQQGPPSWFQKAGRGT